MKRSRFLLGTLSAAALFGLPRVAYASGGLDIDEPSDPLDLRIYLGSQSDRRYRGRLAAINLPDGRNGIVNTLRLEEYLYGVVPMEMPSSWPYAALEAQAILARTFAVRKRNALHPYDLTAGTADQVYGGLGAEALSATAAVDACTGLIVLYEGAPASIAYMSACGGHTDDAARVWGGTVPYMTGVPCSFCAAAPSAHWSVQLEWPTIAGALGLDPAAPPVAVSLVDLGPGGRPGGVQFQTAHGITRIDVGKLREASGYRLPSTFLREIRVVGAGGGTELAPAETIPAPPLPPELAETSGVDDGDRMPGPSKRSAASALLCTGSGSGHGVGVCQWGARGMAAAGYSAQAIVAYYLPHTQLGAASATPVPGDRGAAQEVAPPRERGGDASRNNDI